MRISHRPPSLRMRPEWEPHLGPGSTEGEAQRPPSFRHSEGTRFLVYLPATLRKTFMLPKIRGMRPWASQDSSSPHKLSLFLPQATSSVPARVDLVFPDCSFLSLRTQIPAPEEREDISTEPGEGREGRGAFSEPADGRGNLGLRKEKRLQEYSSSLQL